jgi:hypothetical protein
MPIILFYEYEWRGQRRAITIGWTRATGDVQLWDRLTGEEIAGPWLFDGARLVGDGDLTSTRQDAISAIIAAAAAEQAAAFGGTV